MEVAALEKIAQKQMIVQVREEADLEALELILHLRKSFTMNQGEGLELGDEQVLLGPMVLEGPQTLRKV